jgi:hypothetical protein
MGGIAEMAGTRRHCQLYVPGHTIHYLQAIKSTGQHHQWGILIGITWDMILVEYLDRVGVYRNHKAEELLRVADLGDQVRVCEKFSILRIAGERNCNHCFSVVDADAPWRPCDFTPLTDASPEALAERLITHGGFLVPGRAVLDALQDSGL